MTQSVLNPWLYGVLKQRFGHIEIAGEGEPLLFRKIRSHSGTTRGQMKTEIVDPGEYYKVSCPFCGDRRHRLWVNHRYLTQVEAGGDVLSWVVKCFNDDCMDKSSNRLAFREMVEELINAPDRYARALEPAQVAEPVQLVPIEFQGRLISLAELPITHPAVQYVTQTRGFDVDYLVQKYHVCYCPEVYDRKFWLAKDRLIIPIYMHGMFVGWQARHIGEADWKKTPKYWTMPGLPRRRVIYNWDVAKHSRTLVLFEGATAAWALGDCATALLGKTIGHHQSLLIQEWAASHNYQGTVVLMLDRNAVDEMDNAMPMLQSMTNNRAIRVIPPDHRDAADLDFGFVWRLFQEEAARCKLTLEVPQ